eukprot:8960010-Alexandrium_andersonii.AAC.2
MASNTSFSTFPRSQSMNAFPSPGYRLRRTGDRFIRLTTALMGPADVASNSSNACTHAARSESRNSASGGS